ncbi:MAG: TolC family protein [Burkholderiaceae bacterium]
MKPSMKNAPWVRRCWLSAVLYCGLSLNASAQGLGFEDALRSALERAPSLQARQASLQGATALQISAAQLPDPKLSIGLDSLPINGPNPFSLVRDDFTQRQIGYAQDVPNRAKRAARSEAALARTAREQALLQSERQLVRRDAGLAWLAAYFLQARLELLDAHVEHQRVLLDTAPSQLAAGKISAVDVTTVRLDALALTDQQDGLASELRLAMSQLQRWVGTAPVVALYGPPPQLPVASAALLQQLERNAELAAFTPLDSLAKAEMHEAQAAAQGDWSWNVGFGKRGSGYGDFVSAQVTFELPLSPRERQQPQILARQKEVERVQAEREDLLRKLTQDTQALLAEQEALQRQLARALTQALPLATQRVALALSAYQSGKGALAGVQEARKQTTDLQMRVLELQGRLAAVQWRLNTLIAE